MDVLILLFVAAGIIALILLTIKGMSLFASWKTARKHDLQPSMVEVIALNKFFELDESFLKACLAFKNMDAGISIREIVNHHMADGDTYQLLDKWSELKKRGLSMRFGLAVLYDLSGKDIIEIAAKEEQNYQITVESNFDNTYHILYKCEFSVNPESAAWITPDLEQYKDQIEYAIHDYMMRNSTKGLDHIQKAIVDKVLDKKFWKNLCHGSIHNQELSILMR